MVVDSVCRANTVGCEVFMHIISCCFFFFEGGSKSGAAMAPALHSSHTHAT